MSISRILFVDSPSPSNEALGEFLTQQGFELFETADPGLALEHLRSEEVALVLAELSLAEGLLKATQTQADAPPVLLLDDFASVSQAVEAVRRGAFDTVVRPASNEQILLLIQRALEQEQLRAENRRLRNAIGERFQLGALISRDPRMRRIFDTVGAVSDSKASILLQGESGTGKTVLARTIHEQSSRHAGPFVVVNCGAIPTPLLESELFGHVRGAFTGAVRDREGKFESAEGGTLFLDEIATAPLELQVKLLRVIEEGQFERVGDSKTRQADVRVIAAANVELPLEIEAGRFRADLYYRINVVSIEIPPLRERTGDIPLLAQRFLTRFAQEYGREIDRFDAGAMAALCAHLWPGNVRELENAVERAVLLAKGSSLEAADLFLSGPSEPTPAAGAGSMPWGELPLGPLKEALEAPERWLIQRALEHHGGSRQRTARTLGINRTTLFNKMRKYQIDGAGLAPEGHAEPPPLEQAG